MNKTCSVSSLRPSDINHSLAVPSHAADEPLERQLFQITPLLLEGVLELSQRLRLVRTLCDRPLEQVPTAFDGMQIRGSIRPLHTQENFSLQVVGNDPGTVWRSVVIHEDEVFTDRTCIGFYVDIKDFIPLPDCGDRALWEERQVSCLAC